jgi:hypothetical protein
MPNNNYLTNYIVEILIIYDCDREVLVSYELLFCLFFHKFLSIKYFIEASSILAEKYAVSRPDYINRIYSFEPEFVSFLYFFHHFNCFGRSCELFFRNFSFFFLCRLAVDKLTSVKVICITSCTAYLISEYVFCAGISISTPWDTTGP